MNEDGFQDDVTAEPKHKMTPKEVDYFYESNKELRLTRTVQSRMGLWPYQGVILRTCLRIGIPVVSFTIIGMPHVLAIKKRCVGEEKRFGQCCENLAGMCYILGCLLKYSIPLIKEKKFKMLFVMIAEHWASLKDPKEKLIAHDFARQGSVAGFIFSGVILLSCAGYMQITLLPTILDIVMPLNESRPKILVMNAEFPFDPFEYYGYYYSVYVVGMSTSCFCMVAHDVMYVMIVYQALGVFALVAYRIQKSTTEPDSKAQCDLIITAVHKHRLALRFIDELEITYREIFILFITLIVSILILSAIFIVDHGDNVMDAFRIGLFGIGASLCLFFLNWPGQLITDGSIKLFWSIYEADWYNLSESAKTIMRIIFLRSSKTFYQTAGGIYIMNFENFGKIIKTTMSYMVVATSFR